MPRLKPAALLQHSKRQKGPAARLSVASIVICGVVLLFLSALLIHRRNFKGSINVLQDLTNFEVIRSKVSGADGLDSDARFAVLNTTKGFITVELFFKEAPKTVENFVTHSKTGYYNGVIFHRVIKNFMIQSGDPKGDGTGGDSIWGGPFRDEIAEGLEHEPFTLSMANIGQRNTNKSQFFITTVATPHLDNHHTIFGRVVQGKEVVQEIERVETNAEDRPLVPITIHNITIKDEL